MASSHKIHERLRAVAGTPSPSARCARRFPVSGSRRNTALARGGCKRVLAASSFANGNLDSLGVEDGAVEELEGFDVSPFFDADENKTYEDKVSPAMLKVDWRFPRPGLAYPLYTRSKFLVGWNAVKIMRETESMDEATVGRLKRTSLSVLSYCFSWVWYLIPTPLVFLVRNAFAPALPILRLCHKAIVLQYAKVKFGRAKRAGAEEGAISSVLAAYHGSLSYFHMLKELTSFK